MPSRQRYRTIRRSKIKLLVVLPFLLMLAYDSAFPQRKGADGYEFGEPQFVRQYTYVKLVTYDTQAEVAIAAYEHGFEMWQAVRAFAVLSEDPLGVCELHAVDPQQLYMPEYYGHEILHCFYGNWHRSHIIEEQ